MCVGVVSPAFRHDGPPLETQLALLRSQLCALYARSTAGSVFGAVYMVVEHLDSIGLVHLPDRPACNYYSEAEYQKGKRNWKGRTLHPGFLPKANGSAIAAHHEKEILNLAGAPIGQRLLDIVRQYRNPKHFRGPIYNVLMTLSQDFADWSTNSMSLHQGLLAYRNSLLLHAGRHTAYQIFNRVRKAFRILVEHRLLPAETVLPRNFNRQKAALFIRQKNPALGPTDIYNPKHLSSDLSIDGFLSSYERELTNQNNVILRQARSEVFSAYQAFRSRDQLIAESQIKEFENHPKLRVRNPDMTGRRIRHVAAFGKCCPKRINNIVAFIDKYHNGTFNYTRVKSGGHIDRSDRIEGYFGLELSTMCAMHAIITGELGINPYSLYAVKVEKANHRDEFVQVVDNGNVRINVIKWRQRRLQKRTADGHDSELLHTQPADITASVCLRMALEMTARHRALSGSSNLWVSNARDAAVAVSSPSDSMFQQGFRALCKRTGDPRIHQHNPTLMKLRITNALLIYLRTDGDAQATAQYLGNTVRTAIDTYIPNTLQEAVYRRKMSAHQSLFMYLATADDKEPAVSMRMSEVEYRATLNSIFSMKHLGGPLFDALTAQPQSPDANTHFFCVTERNLSLAIAYARDGSDPQLRDLCSSAVEKVRTGPIALKRMLRIASISSADIHILQ